MPLTLASRIGVAGVPDSVANLVCFSCVSLIEVSSSCSRDLSESTVKLSTVSEFGCNLPSVSSISVSSNWNTIGNVGDVLHFRRAPQREIEENLLMARNSFTASLHTGVQLVMSDLIYALVLMGENLENED